MIKIAICDDEPSQLKLIQSYLDTISEELHVPFTPFYYSDAQSLVKGMTKDISIVLLDIQMKDMTGMEAAKILRGQGYNFYLFFITNNVEYAIEGYEVHAYAFFPKPLLYNHFKHYLSEVIEKIDDTKPQMISLKSNYETKVVDAKKIYYFEVYGHTVKAILENQTIDCSTPLALLEDKLKDRGFYRCHKSFLVNMHFITNINTTSLTLPNGTEIPLSKHKKKEFMQAFYATVGDTI